MAAFDQTERYTDWSESHQQAHDASRASAQHAGPVIVEKNEPDQNTAQVNPALKLARLTDKGAVQWIQVPVIKSAPLLQLGGGGVHITIPVQKGDEGLAIYADRGIDNWWAQGGVQQQDQSRMNQWSDAFIIPGFHSQPNKLKNVDGTSMQMRTTDGKTSFGFNPSQGGSMTMTAPNNPTTMVGKGFNTNVQSQSHNVPNGVSYTTPSINVSGKVDAKGGFFVNGRPVGSGGGGGGDGGGGASSSAGETPPTTPIIGDFWWDSVGGQLYIWYNDNTSSQWVAATNQPGPKGDPGTPGATGARGPTGSQGPAGAQGPIGPIGPQGVPGTPSTVPGPVGPPGPQGAEGVQGPIGPIGAQGYPGTGAYVTGPGLKIDLGTYPATMDVATPYLPLYGGTMTGVLVLAGPPLNPLEAATKAYVDTFAPLASPVFTGNPTAPTPPTADNDTSIATTAWVNLQGFLVAAGASYLPISGGTLTGALVLPPGTVTATSLNFGTPGTGIWTSAAATQINFAAGGLNRVAISSASVNCAVPIIAPLGTVAAPSLTFVGDTTSGFFRKVAGSVSISATNSEVMNWAAASKTTTAYGPLLLAANPSAPLEATAKQYVDAADALALSITAAASTYLTIANAASTYLTIANAASTYLTIANAASTYAPLASPLFTGNPRGPTPATADSSVSLATTAFVKAQSYALTSSLGNYLLLTGGTISGNLAVTGTTTLTGLLTANSGVNAPGFNATGTTAQVLWQDRANTSLSWLWYATGGTTRLYNGADRFTVDAVGNMTGANLFLSSNWITFAGGSGTNNGPGIAGDATNITMRMGTNNGGLYIQNNAATVNYHSFTMDGNAYHNSVLTVDGSVLKRGGGASYRMCPNVNNAGYGSFWYTDAANMYLLLTAVNDAWGSFNSLRPFYINLASGVVSMEQGLVVYNGSIRLNNGSTGNTFITYNGGNYVQMFDDGNGHIESNTQIWINGNTGNGATVGGTLHTGNLYPSNVYMPNNVYIWFLDTVGSARYGLILANDNQYYLSDGTLNVIVRATHIYLNGYTHVQPGTNDNARITVPNNCHARWFYEVAGTRLWSAGCINTGVWYLADESAGAVRMTIGTDGTATFSNNLTTNWSIGANGLWWGNSGGWWWTGSPIHTDSAVQAGAWITAGTDIGAGGQLSCSGNLNVSGVSYLNGSATRVHGTDANDSLTVTCSDYSRFLTIKPQTQNNWCQMGYYCGGAGWGTLEIVGQLYCDNNINCSDLYSRGNLNCPGSIYCNGLQFYNNGGWWWTPNNIHADGQMHCGDLTATGWIYGGGNGGAQIRCWAGDWGAMSYAMSGGYFEVSPDQGASGFYFANAGNWSDARLKLNIRDSEIDALAVIGAIPVRAFEWTEEGRGLMPRDGASVACGIVAQELEELIPSAVDIVPVAGGLAGGGMRRIVSDQLDAYYIRAIQQLTDELAAVKARLTQLEH